MPEEASGVTEAESPSAEGTPQNAAPEPVTSETGSQRPVENLKGEFDRKFGKLQGQLDTVLTYIAQQAQQPRQPVAQPATAGNGQPTDEDLWTQAQQGSREAFELYQQRIADRRIQQAMSVKQRQQIITGQLQALYGKYPILNDPSHPLRQTAEQAYALLVGYGYPADDSTRCEAIKTAIADRPDLVSELYSQTSRAAESVRRSGTSGQTGATVRHEPSSREKTITLNAEQEALAKRMGVKDPAGAIKRFKQRRQTPAGPAGTMLSNMGAVGAVVNEEDL